MNEMEVEAKKREKEFSEWQQACAKAQERASRPPDYYIQAKVYDRNMKSGTYKVKNVPLDKGMAMLIDFTETKIQNGGKNGNNGKQKEEEKKKEKGGYRDIL